MMCTGVGTGASCEGMTEIVLAQAVRGQEWDTPRLEGGRALGHAGLYEVGELKGMQDLR